MPDTHNKQLLQIIADSPELSSVLRELLEAQFAAPNELKDVGPNTSNEVLGEFLRARLVGMEAIRKVFAEIDRYKKPVAREISTHPTR